MSFCRRIKTNNHGFTLIELILVIIIISIMAALTAPALSRSLTGLKVNQAAREMTATLRLARELSMRDRTIKEVAFDLEKETYWIAESGAKGDSKQKEKKIFSLPPEVDLAEVQGVFLKTQSGPQHFFFHPNGSSNGGSIILSKKTGKGVIKIVVNPITGLAVISE